jgi:predicted TIM-barrel fold metal-dependent hydrolase
MVIDVHAHLGPQVGAGVKGASYPSATADDLVKVMDAVGIDRAVVFPTHWQNRGLPADPNYEHANRYVRDAVTRLPGRLIGFGRANPNWGRAAVDELDRCLGQYGMRGIKLHPDWDSFFLGGPLVGPILELAADRQVPVLVYSGYPLRAQPLQILKYAERFPSVPIILGHMAYRMASDAIAVAERARNIYLETSCQWSLYILKAVQVLGPGRVLFGSDFPYEIPAAEMARITEFPGFDKDAVRRMLGDNAAELLRLG